MIELVTAAPPHATEFGNLCKAQGRRFRHNWSANMADTFIEHSREMWELATV
jgi:hypothetical protein